MTRFYITELGFYHQRVLTTTTIPIPNEVWEWFLWAKQDAVAEASKQSLCWCLVGSGLGCTNRHPAVGEKLQDKSHHASLGRCWRLLKWLNVFFIQNSLRSHSAGHRPGRYLSDERRLSATDLGAGMLTIWPLWILCRKRQETSLETAVRSQAWDHVWGSCEQNDEAALGAEWRGNLRNINSLKVIERIPGKQLPSQQRRDC